MSKTAKKILKEALRLPPRERVIVAEKLLSSLDKSDLERNKLWMEEVEHRFDAAECGEIKTVSADTVFNKQEKIPSEAQKGASNSIQLRYYQHIKARQKESSNKPISENPFVGMWKDRSDLADSSSWVEQQRRIQWIKR